MKMSKSVATTTRLASIQWRRLCLYPSSLGRAPFLLCFCC